MLGNLAYLAAYAGLQIIDVSDPSTPSLLGSYDASGILHDIHVVGNYAYVVGGAGLQVVDISNPNAPEGVGWYEWVGDSSVYVVDNYVYVADGDLWVLDVSDPAALREVGFYDSERAYDVFVAGGYIYLADGVSGLLILRFTGGEGATYSISGRVTDSNDPVPNPISGVTISAGNNHTTTTNNDGSYILNGLPIATYRLMASRDGYSFTPAERTVDVSQQDITGQDFIGVADGGPPTPFLDLPFDYGNSSSSFINILKNWNERKGRINSWFDHKYPNYSQAHGLWRYKGEPHTKNKAWMSGVPCYENYCYDGHDAIDFDAPPKVAEPWPVLAAASGIVTHTAKLTVGLGNNVVVYHPVDQGNGYYTRYAHLNSISVTVGVTVTSHYTLGMAGNSGKGGGYHLHFGVYRDDGDKKWEPGQDKIVDPFGWKRKNVLDPWVEAKGFTSHPLWLHDPDQELAVSEQEGGQIIDSAANTQITIPPSAIPGQVILEYSPAPVAGASAQLRSTGYSFWLDLLEWLPGSGNLQTTATLQSTTQFTITQPITLTVAYTETEIPHLDETQLTFYRWDEDDLTWYPLPTTVDMDQNIVTAQTQDLGGFDLQSPLLCATDDLEPDDGYQAARRVWPNDWPLSRGLDISQDNDWASLEAAQGVTYTISTQNLSGGANTVLNLYDVDTLTPLVSNDDAGGGPASELVWTAPYTGTFFVEVVSAPGGTTDCSATYELTIATIPGDVIPDCRVDVADLQAVADRWRLSVTSPDPDGDPDTPNYETRFGMDRDGDVDIVDITRVAMRWGNTCP